MLINDDQCIDRTDFACLYQSFAIDFPDMLPKSANIFVIKFEDIRSQFHAIGRRDAGLAVDSNREIGDFAFYYVFHIWVTPIRFWRFSASLNTLASESASDQSEELLTQGRQY